MNELSLADLVILAAAALYAAYAVAWSYGPFHIFERLRRGNSWCTFCAAFWAAVAVYAIWWTPAQPIVHILAIAGVAATLGEYVGIGDG